MPFGNAVGEGFNNGGTVVASKVIIFGTNGDLLVYQPVPGTGNLIASIAATGGTDPYGNTFLAGVVSYLNTGELAQLDAGFLQLRPAGLGVGAASGFIEADVPGDIFMASGTENGVDTQAGISVTSANSTGALTAGKSSISLAANQVALNASFTATIPFPSAGITTVAQLVAALKQVAILS